MFSQIINTYWKLRLKYQQSKRSDLLKNLDVELRAISLVNVAVREIKVRKNKGKIKFQVSNLLINGLKRALKNGELIYKLKFSNNASIIIRDSSIRDKDIKFYSFSESNLRLHVQLSRSYYTSISLGLFIFGCVVAPIQI
jgi:hypothetical protein